MRRIDGRAGGGQMLRTALALSAIQSEPVEVLNIRGSRSNPGLKKQHLECIRAVQRLTGADVEGAELGSERLVFRPDYLENRSFTANIGTAGSVTLLLDTVLPIATQFDEPFRITVKGGTDVKWSPAIDWYRNVKLELLSHLGIDAELDVKQTGYYPTGGGEVELRTEQSSLEPVELVDRGPLRRFKIYSKESKDLASRNVAERQADELERLLKNNRPSAEVEKDLKTVESSSTGSTLVLAVFYGNTVVGFDELGEEGVRSEDVARKLFQRYQSFESTEAAVDSRMADQLMVLMALTGGDIAAPDITDHVETNAGVIEKFGKSVELEETSYKALISI